ncbi:hypothetical protein WME95_27930 [Sorangium sp. So ce327]|jgi:hypothetical protein|uniref:hypothetical protein n=1 Tax=Sorangium sp. So ce327 TaxID=3133301 RepID=UPI003F6094D2
MSDPVRWLDAEANALETERELLRAAPPADPPDGAQERVWAAMAAQIGLAGAAALGGAQGAAGGALPVNAGGAASAGEIAAAVSAGKVASAAAGAGAAGTAVTGGVTAAAGAAGILKAMLFGAACGGLIVAGYVVVAPSSEAPPARIVEAAEAVAAPVSAPVSPQEDRGLAAQAEPAPAEPPPAERAPAEPPPVEAPLRSRPLPPAEAPLPNRSPARTGPRAAATPASPGAPLLERAASAPPAARADVLEAAPAPEATGAELGAEGASSPGLRESRLREELTLLGDARAALRRGDASGALRIAEQARLRFPGGALAQEREALTIEALWQSGDRAAAAQRASAFLLAYPSSPHVPRLRSFTTH